jgi:hypothetical protein
MLGTSLPEVYCEALNEETPVAFDVTAPGFLPTGILATVCNLSVDADLRLWTLELENAAVGFALAAMLPLVCELGPAWTCCFFRLALRVRL